MVKLIVGIPTYEGHAQYIPQLLESLKQQTIPHEIFFANTSSDPEFAKFLEKTGHRVLSIYPAQDRDAKIAAGRNAVRSAFLETDATHLCWVDTDMTLPTYAFEQLLADEKEIVSGAYLSPFYIEGKLVIAPVAFSIVPDKHIGQFIPFGALFTKAILRMRAVGFGICMIQRKVLEQVTIKKKDGINGEDFLFCIDADKLGYPTYLDTRIWAKHHAWPIGDSRNDALNIELQGKKAGFL
jgi:glycosyltransferase involved in cell wall biosynthesis